VGDTAVDRDNTIILTLMISRRQALLLELGAVEDFLISSGCLARRTLLTRRERKAIDRRGAIEYNIKVE
jgi:hypothetical protein